MSRRATLRDGSSVEIRPIERADRDRFVAAFERLSPESRYSRFMRPMHKLSDADADYLTDVDHRDHEALVAVAPGGELVAVARYVRDREPDVAEAAITVADEWQGRGLARTLLERLVERARDERIVRFRALVQSDNRSALSVLESLGETHRSQEGATVELDIALPAETGLGPQLAHALRAAAAGTLVLARDALARLAPRREPRRRPMRSDPIVVGTDGSATAATAVRHAGVLARALGAPLHVVSAFRPLLGRGDVDAVLDSATATAAAGDVSTHARPGDPADALIDVADEQRAQLIVVGSRGMSGSARYLLGSVPDRVSHHASCNVLIVRTA